MTQSFRDRFHIPRAPSGAEAVDLAGHSLGRTQERLLSGLCKGKSRLADLDWHQADTLIARDLGPLQ